MTWKPPDKTVEFIIVFSLPSIQMHFLPSLPLASSLMNIYDLPMYLSVCVCQVTSYVRTYLRKVYLKKRRKSSPNISDNKYHEFKFTHIHVSAYLVSESQILLKSP